MFQGRSWALIALGSLLSISAFASEPEAVPGEYVVKLKPVMQVQGANFQTLSQRLGVFVKSAIPEDNIVVVKRPVIETRGFAIKSLNQNPLVDVAEPNFIYRVSKTPNDPMYGNLWGMHNGGQADSENQVGTVGVDINVEKAWDLTTGSSDVLVAVIDTGLDYTHPDLAPNAWVNQAELNGQAGVDDDNNGYVDDIHGMNFVDADKPTNEPMDDHGHGSHCSGTIGAKGDDGKGIVGVNWNVKIMPVKFLSADGGGTLEGAIKAIDYATKMGAKVMSNSWGGGGFSQNLQDAIQRSADAGAIFIAAAGNDSNNNDVTASYPATFPVANIVSVAAIDNQGKLASFSNYGKKSVHVAAPGVNIYSSVFGGKYDSWSGTSMATPHVSGIAALMLAYEPTLTAADIKARLIGTARPLAGLRGKVASGLVDAYAALTNTTPPPDMNDPVHWATKDASVSSAHPYKDKTNQTFEVNVDGAKEIALYFSKFDTESGFDKVTFFDKSGKKIGEMSGKFDDSFSPTIAGDYVKIVFTSDDSVNRYGFDITKVAYR